MTNEMKKQEQLLFLIWAQAVIATAGSLYYSEVMGYVPCELCWVQRIFMYPLVVIYGFTLFKKNVDIAIPGLLMSGIGMFISTYHYLIQKLPALQEAGDACGVVPCNLQYVNYFGFITIPFLAGVAFIVIFVLHMMLWKQSRRK
ncbi:disulfide bond formation protein B [Ornithinibacillus gellani]|uniref:disulfide oxidoreductase n=1 Tax=Ornithinibacillus gellani TaxID=2293253 RepID=UPI000F471851|nr:disulfide oxidoreductase [Ornithinibacillus gellani]TQS76664.1 disulfide bond formation protein B [Ornithinibacillus gellani]